MKPFLIILFFTTFFVRQNINAQNYFNRVYDYDNTSTYNNAATACVELSNGDFLLSTTKYYSPTFSALHYIVIDLNGDTVFSKRYPKNNCAYYTGTSGALQKTFDNNLIQTGYYYDSSLTTSDVMLVKLKENGDTLWTKFYGGAADDYAFAVCQTPDSGYVIMGGTQSYSMGSASDIYLIKTDSLGNFEWQQTYGTTLAEDCVSGQITLDGGFIMSGIKNSLLYAIKTDSNGIFEWDRQISGTAGTGYIKQLEDSTYILVGSKFISGLSFQAYMAKLSKTGSVIWEKNYGDVGDQQFYAVPVVLDDGSIVCSGISTVGTPWGLLIKTDSLGNQQWLRTYYANPSNQNYFYDFKKTNDNGFLMVGTGNITGQDAWVVKVDSAGCEIANCNVGINEFPISDSKLLVYPNPATSEINISIEGENIHDYNIQIVNVLGQLQDIEINQSVINISNFAEGVYFISLINKEKRYTSKFIKE